MILTLKNNFDRLIDNLIKFKKIYPKSYKKASKKIPKRVDTINSIKEKISPTCYLAKNAFSPDTLYLLEEKIKKYKGENKDIKIKNLTVSYIQKKILSGIVKYIKTTSYDRKVFTLFTLYQEDKKVSFENDQILHFIDKSVGIKGFVSNDMAILYSIFCDIHKAISNANSKYYTSNGILFNISETYKGSLYSKVMFALNK